MDKSKKAAPNEQDEVEEDGVNWPVVAPILIVIVVIILYIFLF